MATPARATPLQADVAFERRALTLLAELSQALAVSVDIGETLHEAVNRIADCMQAEAASVFMLLSAVTFALYFVARRPRSLASLWPALR